MKLWLTLFFGMINSIAFAQEKAVNGIVFDKNSKARLAKVKVLNITSGNAVYNNFKGEFSITAKPGDKLIFSKPDHISDTVIIKNYTPLAVYLRPTAIQLREVIIRDSLLNPQKQLAATKNEYSRIYGSLSNSDVLTSQGGFSIDALFNAFSRSGRNAEHLREIIDNDYKQHIIDYRFNKAFVQGVTNLKEPQLTDFMQKYRPGYYQVITAGDYEFISYIKKSLKRYMRNPKAYELAPLITPK